MASTRPLAKHVQRAPIRMPYTDLTKGRFSASGHAYLITTVTTGRSPYFLDFRLASIVARELHAVEKWGECRLLAWVLMPDHLHVLLVLNDRFLSHVMSCVKGRTAHAVNLERGSGGNVWQRGFYDHAIRREEDLIDIARYIVANPLRAGIVRRLSDYPFWNAAWI
jgi:REP element-mobilizing transposase RayT